MSRKHPLARRSRPGSVGLLEGRPAWAFGAQPFQNRYALDKVREFRITLPPQGEIRVRNLVHRGASRPVFKVPSLKLGRIVQCESQLEVEIALLLEASTQVTTYCEQPVTFHCLLDGERTWHIPDFEVNLTGTRVFIEVKYARDVDALVLARTALLQELLQKSGHRYLLLTEKEIRQPYMVGNARQILRRACHAISDLEITSSFERFRRQKTSTLGEWSWQVSGKKDAIAMARLLLKGHALVDMGKPIGSDTVVVLTEKREVQPWLLALSA